MDGRSIGDVEEGQQRRRVLANGALQVVAADVVPLERVLFVDLLVEDGHALLQHAVDALLGVVRLRLVAVSVQAPRPAGPFGAGRHLSAGAGPHPIVRRLFVGVVAALTSAHAARPNEVQSGCTPARFSLRVFLVRQNCCYLLLRTVTLTRVDQVRHPGVLFGRLDADGVHARFAAVITGLHPVHGAVGAEKVRVARPLPLLGSCACRIQRHHRQTKAHQKKSND